MHRDDASTSESSVQVPDTTPITIRNPRECLQSLRAWSSPPKGGHQKMSHDRRTAACRSRVTADLIERGLHRVLRFLEGVPQTPGGSHAQAATHSRQEPCISLLPMQCTSRCARCKHATHAPANPVAAHARTACSLHPCSVRSLCSPLVSPKQACIRACPAPHTVCTPRPIWLAMGTPALWFARAWSQRSGVVPPSALAAASAPCARAFPSRCAPESPAPAAPAKCMGVTVSQADCKTCTTPASNK